MKLPKFGSIVFIGVVMLVILPFFYFILGLSAAMSVLGIVLLFIVPMFFILDNFNLEQDEKIIFSFFIGVGVFPSITYWVGMIMSFRVAIFVSFIVLAGAGVLIRRFYRKKQ
ncbi:hypothetical protein HYX02_01215 [Candidatus Woesearchaeota archaeon]|nr:hypothetical protein [Candidatus Woesearchaeota archaeon]